MIRDEENECEGVAVEAKACSLKDFALFSQILNHEKDFVEEFHDPTDVCMSSLMYGSQGQA